MQDKLILYTINCPKCKVLEAKLDRKGLFYDVVDSVDEMTALGIRSAPVLSVNGDLMTFSEAIKWIGTK